MAKKPQAFVEADDPKSPVEGDPVPANDPPPAGDPQPDAAPVEEPPPISDGNEGLRQAAANAAKTLAEDRARVDRDGNPAPLLDSVQQAALQKQVDWENDSKEFFRDEDHGRQRREAMLAEMDKRDLAERKEQRLRDAEKKKADDAAEAERLEADAAAKRAQADELEHRAAELRS